MMTRLHSCPLSRLAALTIAILAAATAVACHSKQAPKTPAAIPVVSAPVRRMPVPFTVQGIGIVSPEQTANVTSLDDGVITSVLFREGQDVKKAQSMFQIDRRPYVAAYDQAVAALKKDEATLINDQHEDVRYADLVKKDYVTQEQADEEHFAYESQKATVAADSANVATARYNLDNASIVAPITGQTGILYVRVGNTVHGASATTLTTINQIHPILVEFSIVGTSLPTIQKYRGAGKKLPVTVYQTSTQPQTSTTSSTMSVPMTASGDSAAGTAVGAPGATTGHSRHAGGSSRTGSAGTRADSGGPPTVTGQGGQAGGGGAAGTDDANGVDQNGTTGGPPGGTMTGVQSAVGTPTGPPIYGDLAFVNNAIDTTTGMVVLKGEFPNTDDALWPGEYVVAILQLYVQQDALVVPSEAVMAGQQGTYVYVVDQTGIARQRNVTIDRTSGDLDVIASGVKEGDVVVTDGQSRLTPNAKVTMRAAAPTATAAAQPAGTAAPTVTVPALDSPAPPRRGGSRPSH